MNYFRELFKYWLGPALLFAMLIFGVWVYNDISAKNAAIAQQQEALVLLKQQTVDLSALISGQCEQLLKAQGKVVGEFVPPEEEAEVK